MPPINKVPVAKVVVEKCDHGFPSKKVSVSSRLSATPTPSKLASQHLPTTDKLKSYTAHLDLEEEVEVDEEGDLIMIDEDEEGPSVPTGIRNRWNNRRRWRRRGLLPGMKTGMSVSGSQALQLVKRSKFQQQLQQQQIQQRFDHAGPGRLRTSLLKGITKKRLKRLVESMKRRKLKVKKISAQTKFKDVRVDIINCVCGRTDEFGLMVQVRLNKLQLFWMDSYKSYCSARCACAGNMEIVLDILKMLLSQDFTFASPVMIPKVSVLNTWRKESDKKRIRKAFYQRK